MTWRTPLFRRTPSVGVGASTAASPHPDAITRAVHRLLDLHQPDAGPIPDSLRRALNRGELTP